MKALCGVEYIAFILVIIGALNWGLVGVFNVDVVAHLLGAGSMGSKIVYALIGIAGVIMLILCKCKKGECKVH